MKIYKNVRCYTAELGTPYEPRLDIWFFEEEPDIDIEKFIQKNKPVLSCPCVVHKNRGKDDSGWDVLITEYKKNTHIYSVKKHGYFFKLGGGLNKWTGEINYWYPTYFIIREVFDGDEVRVGKSRVFKADSFYRAVVLPLKIKWFQFKKGFSLWKNKHQL